MMTSSVLSPGPPPPDRSDAQISKAIDEQLVILIKDILPSSPYIQRIQEIQGRSLPQPTQQFYWWHGTPFSKDEQELQYLTFRPHSEGLVTSHGQWDDGNGGLAPKDGPQSNTSSNRTPLHGSGVKKKITLADYKNRGKANSLTKDGVPTSSSPKPGIMVSDSGKVAIGRSGGEREGLQDRDAQRASGMPDDHSASSEPGDPLEKRRNSSKGGMERTAQVQEVEQRPAKRRRLSDDAKPECQNGSLEHAAQTSAYIPQPERPPEQIGKAQPATVKLDDDHLKHHGPRENEKVLSNGHAVSELPPMLSPTLPDVLPLSLPTLLSPTLPPGIEEAFTDTVRRGRKQPREEQASKLAASHSQSVSSLKVAARNTPASQRGVAQPISHKHGKKTSMSSSIQLSKWFVIKIRKRDRKRILDFLKLPPDPNANYLKVHWKDDSRPINNKTNIDQPHLPPNRNPSEKLGSNRGKRPLEPQSPETSRLPDSSPMAPNTPSNKRARLSNAATSSAMSRVTSGQGLATTPLSHSRHATPSTPNKQEAPSAHRAETERLIALGRDLKHSSDKYLQRDKSSLKHTELGLAIAIESVLTFMLVAAIRDERSRRRAQAGNSEFWKGILPFLTQSVHRAQSHPRLAGLLLQLEGVIRDTVSYYYQLSSRAQHQDATGSNDVPLAVDAAENYMQAGTAWRDGNNKLWTHHLENAFPLSWAKARRKTSRGKGQDPVAVDDYKVDFALPMSVSTTGIEAVNAGVSLLREYCERQGVDWRAKLVL